MDEKVFYMVGRFRNEYWVVHSSRRHQYLFDAEIEAMANFREHPEDQHYIFKVVAKVVEPKNPVVCLPLLDEDSNVPPKTYDVWPKDGR
jgi:hypothetical protein